MTVVSHQSPEVLMPTDGERFTDKGNVCVFTGADVERDENAFHLYGGFLLLRGKYVEKMGWLRDREAPDDTDRYDLNPETHYFIKTDQAGEVQSGFRLTPIPEAGLKDSLSMDMWAAPIDRGSPETIEQMEAQDAVLRMLENGPTWDLTRLVTRGSVEGYRDKEQLQAETDALIELFGAGVAVTGRDAFWVYTTTEGVYDFLDNRKLAPHLIVRDEITPGDGYESMLCYQDVGEAVASMRHKNSRKFPLLEKGHGSIIGGNG